MVEVKAETQNASGNGQNDGGRSKPLEPEAFRKLFIGGLSLNTTDEALREYYSKFGELLDCVVMRDSQTKKSRGFGFVSFSCKEEVDNAMNARPHEIDGKTIDPKRAVPRDQSFKSESNLSTKRLYVSGVREEHTEEDFTTYFNDFGKVEKVIFFSIIFIAFQVEIITDKTTGKPRGFAFISFDDYDSVDKCVLQKSHMVRNYRCDVKKALSKDDMNRAQQIDRDRAERGNRSRGNQRGGGGPWGGPGGGRPGRGGDYPPWGGPAPAWGGPPGQWSGPGKFINSLMKFLAYGGGYGGGYGGYGSGPAGWGGPQGGGWSQGGPASAWGAPPAGGWAADSNPAGWGSGAGGASVPAPSQNPAAAAAGWNASSAGQWSSGGSGGGQAGAGGPSAGRF